MNASQIAEFIKRPAKIQSTDLEDLKHLTEQFPYSQLFSILYLKGLSQVGSMNFEKELQNHSYRIGDRQQLYFLINDHVEFNAENSREVIESDEAVHEEIMIPIISKEDNESEEQTEIVEANNVDTAEDDINEEILEEPIEKSNDYLEKTILEHAVSSNYVLEELSEEELIKLEEKEQEKNTSKEIIEETTEAMTPALTIEGKQSFTSWINSNVNNTFEDKEDEKAIRAIVNNFHDFDPTEKLFGEAEKPKKEFFSPIKKAKESLREEGLPVSETLAKIYALQGNYPKAIDAYQQLSLKYPEKKVFFADLISELEKKINIK